MANVAVMEQTSDLTSEQPKESRSDLFETYPYGWRYVHCIENGIEQWKQVPLTREDLLHPQLGDTKVHYEYHERFCTYLYDGLVGRLATIPNTLVLHDVGIYWDDPQLKHHSPDIAVISHYTD